MLESPNSSFSTQTLSPKVRDFLSSLESFQDLVAQYNFRLKTHSAKSLETFQSLPEALQTEIITGFTSYLGFLTKCHHDGIDLRNDKLLLATFLQMFGFIFDKRITDNVSFGDVVEVYSAGQKQIFRNLVFMDLCNYTLLDLLAHEPSALYERSDKIKKFMTDSVITLMCRPYNTDPIDLSHIPVHVIRELFSENPLSSMVEFRVAYPLYSWPPKDLAGFVVIQRGRNIEDAPADLSFL